MSIYAIADLHLSFNNSKPMDIFGDEWKDHESKIKKSWEENVKDEDLVLLPGDFSWETYLEDTYKDFEYLNSLPGKKILLKGNHDYWWTTLTNIRNYLKENNFNTIDILLNNLPGKKLLLKGNHDYWWTTISKMRNYLKENNFNNIDFIFNNSYCFENHVIVGTRGWSPTEDGDTDKMIKREVARLELSFADGIKNYGEDKEFIVCTHYPPMKELLAVMKNYNVKVCLYGHLHGTSQKDVIEGMVDGIKLKMISCDYLNFKIEKIV